MKLIEAAKKLGEPVTLSEARFSKTTKDCYCVGGLICTAALREFPDKVIEFAALVSRERLGIHFPSENTIFECLVELGAETKKAMGAAGRIIWHNDSGRFEEAWKEAEEVLNGINGS